MWLVMERNINKICQIDQCALALWKETPCESESKRESRIGRARRVSRSEEKAGRGRKMICSVKSHQSNRHSREITNKYFRIKSSKQHPTEMGEKMHYLINMKEKACPSWLACGMVKAKPTVSIIQNNPKRISLKSCFVYFHFLVNYTYHSRSFNVILDKKLY